MFQLVRLLFYMLREFIFDHKDEYDYRSAQFSSRKVMIFILLLLSFLMNGWLFFRLFQASGKLWICHQQVISMETKPDDDVKASTPPSKPPSKKAPGPVI